MADDSGLEVTRSMDSQESFLHASGQGATDERTTENFCAFKQHPMEKREPSFALWFLYPNGKIYTAEGICRGIIRTAYRDKGFGYDPIFIPDG